MPLQLTSRSAKNPYRVTKPKSPFPRRKSSSSASPAPRRTSTQSPRRSSAPKIADETLDEPLDDTGLPASLVTDQTPHDAVALIRHIHERMWTELPDRGAGMNSTRIAEVLNFRRDLPPIVSVAHLHALGESPTSVERAIASHIARSELRRVVIPHRGIGGDAVGDGLVLISDWEECMRRHPSLSSSLKDKYAAALRNDPASRAVPLGGFTPTESSALAAAGFLTCAHAFSDSTPLSPSTASIAALNQLSKSGSRFASGSYAAVGGPDVFTAAGGSGGGALSISGQERRAPASQYQFAIPGVGPYLKLLISARSHLLALLAKASRHREAPTDMLRERWDGGVASGLADAAKRVRGELSSVLPGQTRKWRQFYGLRFEWVLEECLGAGLVECFQTGSVGLGVRAT